MEELERAEVEQAADLLLEIIGMEGLDLGLRHSAGNLAQGFVRELKGSSYQGDKTPDGLHDFAEKVEKSRKAVRRTFKTSVFKCLDEMELCVEKGYTPLTCRALTAICIGRQLIPFVPH
jgi:hypothetical protein